MHIILGILGAVVTLLILAKRLQDNGIDITWLNPFLWARRRKFRKEYEAHPAYTLESPIDVAAILLIAVAKADGDITLEQKELVLKLYIEEMKLSEQEAQALFRSSVHIFGRGDEVLENPSRVLARTIDKLSQEQVTSITEMLTKVASISGMPSPKQQEVIKNISKALP